MKVEVLISTLEQRNYSFLNHMNIRTDAIVINQTQSVGYEELRNHNNLIRCYSLNERGIGLSRNNALMRSNADICLLADDDMVYEDNYEDIVINAFKKNPKADVIMFNVPIIKKDKTIVKIKKNHRVYFYNSMKYGSVNIAFRRKAILKNNIYFSLLFGGTTFGSGEDSLFIKSCLDKGLVIYSVEQKIACIDERKTRPSTWFTGYDEKYFVDRGALFYALNSKIWILLSLQFLLRKKTIVTKDIPFNKAFKLMCKGAKKFKKV